MGTETQPVWCLSACPLLQLEVTILQMLFDHFQESDYEHWATTGILILHFQVPAIYNSNMVAM